MAHKSVNESSVENDDPSAFGLSAFATFRSKSPRISMNYSRCPPDHVSPLRGTVRSDFVHHGFSSFTSGSRERSKSVKDRAAASTAKESEGRLMRSWSAQFDLQTPVFAHGFFYSISNGKFCGRNCTSGT